MTTQLLSELLYAKPALAVATWTATTPGPTLDTHLVTAGHFRRALLMFHPNVPASATGTLEVHDSADGVTFNLITGASYDFDNDDNGKVLLGDVDLASHRRYIRARIVSPTNSPSGSAAWICGDPRVLPVTVTQDNSVIISV